MRARASDRAERVAAAGAGAVRAPAAAAAGVEEVAALRELRRLALEFARELDEALVVRGVRAHDGLEAVAAPGLAAGADVVCALA